MKKNKIKVATYIRVAGNDHASIFRKNEELKELLEAYNDEWEVVDNSFDYGVSGRKMNRPGLNHVLELCKTKEIDMVVTLESYMLARDVLLYKDIYNTIRNSGVELYISELKKKTRQAKEAKPNYFIANLCPAV